tara:strand:- start:372 stop:617 length:246 start_codon:yes stop_codon:yes gene_type:complete
MVGLDLSIRLDKRKGKLLKNLGRELNRVANNIKRRSVPRPNTHRSDTHRWEIYCAGYTAPKSVKLDKARANDLRVELLGEA